MAKGGRKYRLILYEEIIDRWWPMTLSIAVIIFLNVGALWGAQWYFIDPTENPLPVLSDNGGYVMLGMGGFALIFTFFLLFMRRRAYLQLFETYMRLATPFLRVNISYKRIQSTTTAQVASLFPPRQYQGLSREIIGPLAGETAIVMHLTGYPLPKATFKMFLSSFFFSGKTPHFVLIVDDWMSFSMELDSRRMGSKTSRNPTKPRSTSDLLSDINRR